MPQARAPFSLHFVTIILMGIVGSYLAYLHSRIATCPIIVLVEFVAVVGLISEFLLRLRYWARAQFEKQKRLRWQFGLRTALIGLLLAGLLIQNICGIHNDSGDLSYRSTLILLTFFALVLNFTLGRWQQVKSIAEQRTKALLDPGVARQSGNSAAESAKAGRI